jgi:hypothetical protein
MRITEHFTFEEFVRTARCPELQEENRASGAAFLHNYLALGKELEKIREQFARPIFITSGYRCHALNAAVGGANMSQHLVGAAVDFVVKDFQDLNGMKLVFEWARRNCDYGQLILEAPEGRKSWIHMGLPEPLRGISGQAFVWDGKKYERVG